MPGGITGWFSRKVENLSKATLSSMGKAMGGEVVTACEYPFRRFESDGFPDIFLGKEVNESVIKAISEYRETLSLYPAVLSDYVRVTGKYTDSVVELLKKYRAELETFKNVHSTFNDIESSKKVMKEIVDKLYEKTMGIIRSKYTAEDIRKSPSTPENMTITSYLIGDFANQFIGVLNYTIANFDNVIIILSDQPVIDYKALQIKGDKNKRKETLTASVTAKHKKDAEAAKKKVDGYFKEAKKIHDKLKSAYDSMLKTYESLERKSTVFTEDDLARAKGKLVLFNNETIVPICKLIGLGCCKFIHGEGLSKSELQKIEEELKEKQGMSIIEIANDIRVDILQGHYLETPPKVRRVPEAFKRLGEIKELEKESPAWIKGIREMLGKIAKTPKVPKVK